jgi:FkbM family methyltransferase
MGAQIGAFTLDASRAVGEAGRVFVIEPLSQSFKLFQMNLEANKFKNVTTFHIAAGDHDGTMLLNIYKSSTSASVGPRS